jgi:hypothetical protein
LTEPFLGETNPIMPDASDAYLLEARWLPKLQGIAARLDDPRTLSFDDRRDLANLLNLIISDVGNMPVNAGEIQTPPQPTIAP